MIFIRNNINHYVGRISSYFFSMLIDQSKIVVKKKNKNTIFFYFIILALGIMLMMMIYNPIYYHPTLVCLIIFGWSPKSLDLGVRRK